MNAAQSIHESAARCLELAAELEAEGRLHEAARALEEIHRDDRDPMIDVRIVRLRHEAFRACRAAAASPRRWPEPADRFPGTIGIPEVAVDQLDVEVLHSALFHHGSLIVRGLLDAVECAQLRSDIDEAFTAYDERAFKPVESTAPWFAQIEVGDDYVALDPLEGAFLRSAGGVYAPCAPRAFVEYRSALAEAGLIDVIAGYFGDTPVLSVNKCVLRRIGGGARPSWHQDGSYLGTDISAVNLWVSLSRCGGDSDVMGLDILPGRQQQLAPMGTHDAIDPRAVSQQVVEDFAEASGRPIVRPLFEPGDGILFDHFFLHRSDTRPLPKERYAVESWFFAPATYPHHQIPVVAG